MDTEAAWSEWAGGGKSPQSQNPKEVPALLRRRVSPLGQRALKAAWSLEASLTAPMVFCSRHGEFARTLSILDALVAGTEVSPADFTLSVHNALAGLLSIARANRQGHTMIAAGAESFGFGMLEALARIAERPDEPVLLVHFDEPLPIPFDVFNDGPSQPIALAITLSAAAGKPLTLDILPAKGASLSRESAGMAFIRAMLGTGLHTVNIGEQFAWHWRDTHAES